MGHDVHEFAMGERLDFFSNSKMKNKKGRYVHAFSEELAGEMALDGLLAHCFKSWPEILFIVSGFYTPPRILQICKARGIKVVLLCTESPYEEDRQLSIARSGCLDAVLLNDPTHISEYQGTAPIVAYQPHCYDPDIHRPGDPVAEWVGDVAWVGTPYPSRIAFMTSVDWTGLDLKLAGNWTKIEDDHPLAPHVIHDREDCFDNPDTVRLYRSVKASFNTYRKEASHPDLVEGWALGPREVETIATGCFLAREARGEGDVLLSMLPTFTEPEELGDLLRWWCTHDTQRQAATVKAYEAIADRTFANSAAQLLNALESVPAVR